MSTARVPLLPAPLRWFAVAAVAVVILVASVTRPTGPTGTAGPLGAVGLDKWLHAVGYAVLTAAIAYALADRERIGVAVTAFAVAVAFGLLVELVQFPIPYRQFSLRDLGANAAGATVAAVTWSAVAARARVRRGDARQRGE